MSPKLLFAVFLGLTLAACSSSTVAPVADPATSASSSAEVASWFQTPPPLHPDVDGWDAASFVLVDPAGNDRARIAVRVAATGQERAHGLMFVPELPRGAGMVFVYEEDRTGGFWMKNTLIPLQIAWFNRSGEVVDIKHMDPCEADPCPIHAPAGAYVTALEVTAGFLDELGLSQDWSGRLDQS